MELADFVKQHTDDDPFELSLHRDRWPDVDVALAAECIRARKKLRTKVPEWYADTGIICPSALAAEQCSSTLTARFKAGLVADAKRIADLTGGLGIDTWQFARNAEAVLYLEKNPVLVSAARQNLARFACGAVSIKEGTVDAEVLPGLLDDFRPDVVYMDPARRDVNGRKVFLPEDCSPDVLELQDIILGRGIRFLLKLSPMADISLMLRKFHCVKTVHAVQTDGECKELLLLLEPGFDGDPEIKAVVLDDSSSGIITFSYSGISAAKAVYIDRDPLPGQWLFEPGPALAKTGAFNLFSGSRNLPKLGPSTHLFCFPHGEDGKAFLSEYGRFGNCFTVNEVVPFGKAAIKDFASRWPDAEISARGLRISSDELKAKMKLRGGGDTHIFAVDTVAGKLLIAGTPVSPAPR